jgi:superfamily II DNA/RNA helicase
MYKDYLTHGQKSNNRQNNVRKKERNYSNDNSNTRDNRASRTYDTSLGQKKFNIAPRFKRAPQRKYGSSSFRLHNDRQGLQSSETSHTESSANTYRKSDFRNSRRSSLYSSNSRYSSNKAGFNRGRSKNKRSRMKGIDPEKFIKKAVIKIEEQEYLPTIDFQNLDIVDQLKKNLLHRGYTNPTPIQDETIPLILQGRDVFGLANTGTGKTAAFLLPLIDKVVKDPSHKVLIIAPTRELAEQINQEFFLFTKFIKVFSVLTVGGSSIHRQLIALKRSYNFVIGTPGRMKDLYDRGSLKFEQFGTIVLDEVDRMLDMGFIDDMKFIASKLPENRHTLFFSATSTREVEEVMHLFLKNYVKVSVKTGDTTENVDQDVVWLNREEDKLLALINILENHPSEKVIVFLKTKIRVDRLEYELRGKGFRVSAIHGNKSQYNRRKALKQFKDGQTNILLATDVAARGLDIPNVAYVINFDVPENFDDYVHRIGRTGRAGKSGNALTFVVGQRSS